MTTKTSTLLIATKTPGVCNACRHANHDTVDFEEGRLFCWFVKQPKRDQQTCDVELALPRTSNGPLEPYFVFEAHDGSNGTFDRSRDVRILAEDADEELRKQLRAGEPVID